MLHRMVMAARTKIDLGKNALKGELGSILSCCMKHSVDGRMTGGLVWHSGYLLEVIEGERDTLRRFFDLVSSDSRISDLELIEFVPIRQRDYETWRVGSPKRRLRAQLVRDVAMGRATASAVRKFVADVLDRNAKASSPPIVMAA